MKDPGASKLKVDYNKLWVKAINSRCNINLVNFLVLIARNKIYLPVDMSLGIK